MLNRLIIAVFGIALIMALGSTALAGPGVERGQPAQYERFDLSNPKLADVATQDIRPTQPSFKKPASALRALPPGTPSPGTPGLIYFCDAQSYAGPPAYFWTLPDAYGDDLFNTRFTVEAEFDCTLKVAHLLMYRNATTGTPDMRVYLWDDDGFGFPGAVLDSVDVPYATMDAIWTGAGSSIAYMPADFSAAGWVFSDGAEYHYGYTPIGGAGDTLAIISEDGTGPFAGEERSSEYYAGAWGSMLNDWGGDYTFDIVSERCCSEIPFSDCYTQSYAQNLAYFWRAPHPVFGDSSYAMRFDVGGPETLVSVDLYIYDPGDGSAGNDDVYITVYDDDGAGQPGAQITQATLPAGTYPFFPSVTSVPFAPLVLTNTFHVAFSSAGAAGVDYESCLSSDGSDGVGRSNASGDPTWPGGTDWYSMLAWWGGDFNFIIDANLCRDEFSQCSFQPNCLNGLAYFWRLPDRYGDYINAQKVPVLGEECRINEVTWALYWAGSEAALPLYTFDSKLSIYDDVGGLPGSELYSTTISVADYGAPAPGGGLFFVTKDVQAMEWDVSADYWVAIESFAPDTLSGIRTLTDAGGGGCNLASAEYYGAWGHMGPDWGLPDDVAFYMEVEECCIPFSGRECSPPDLWAAGSHDLGRTGQSQLALEDAWCDLNVDWYYETPSNPIQYQAPIIYDGRAFVSTQDGVGNNSTIEVFDLYDGTHIETLAGAEFANFVLNDPLIVNDVLYIAGGDNRVISAWDISVWGASALNWSRTLGGAVGPTRSTHLMLLDVGGTDVLFGGSQTGRVFALDASTGADYGGWAMNPIALDAGQLVRNAASDGSQLFFTTYIAGLDGDVWSIDPATGSVNWTLSASGGRQGAALEANTTAESFASLSTDNGVVFAGSRLAGDFPADGVFYRINAGDGSLVGDATLSNGFFSNTFVTDVNLVYGLTVTRWVGGTAGRPLLAFNRATGSIAWEQVAIYEGDHNGGYLGNGALSCEPELSDFPADILVTNDIDGNLNFWNSVTGDNLFRRRWDYGPGVSDGTSASIGTDSSGAVHVVATSLFGGVIGLSKGADRPRLEIQDYDPTIAVEFSVSVSEIYTVENIIANTGCADLTFSAVNVDDATFGSTDPGIVSVRPGLLETVNSIADQLTANSKSFKNPQEFTISSEDEFNAISSIRDNAIRNERGNRAALAFPVYLNSVLEPFAGQVVAGGDSADLVLDVNPSLIQRGPQVFYIELQNDDPDFFLNAGSGFLPSPYPELIITLVGGCLTDTTALEFGAGGANYQWVTNTTRLADGDWDAHGFDIDGNDAQVYQGGYIFGVSPERIAFNCADWTGSTGPEASWISVQGDPNWCDNACKPALSTGVNLGAMWDGASYAPITGNMICASWIDSVQNFSNDPDTVDPASWDWKNFGAPFNDSLTMGLYGNTRTLGVPDEPAFSQLTLEIFEITERNGDSVPGWRFGVNYDYDITSPDTAILDQSISAAWATSGGVDTDAWGLVKIPFGCGYVPMINARALSSDEGHFIGAGGAARGDGYMDSAYYFMGLPFGSETSQNIGAASDNQFHATIALHDFGPNETLTFGVANFAFGDPGPTVSDGYADGGGGEISALAYLVNKWAGFGRGDVNDDNAINLGDIMGLAAIVNGASPGAIPFEHLADVDADGDVDNADLQYMIDYYFNCGPCPAGAWEL